MLRKIILIVVIAFLVFLVWNKYGYLLSSFKNTKETQKVSDEPKDQPKIGDSDDSLAFLNLPENYRINYFSSDVPGARSLAIGDSGVVYVGTRDEGVVYALEDNDGDSLADKRYVVSSGLNNPNGVTYYNGDLYVAEINRIIKFSDIDHVYQNKPSYSVLYNDLPRDTHHGWRYLSIGPDKKLYLGIGAPCNNCENKDPYGSIARLNIDGTGFEIIARGVRNTVGFDWNPEDQSLWFTDNGRDEMGDDLPRDELNQLKDIGEDFGYPYCHAGDILDPKYGIDKSCSDYASPMLNLSPHAAALGMKFLDGKVLIAEHGSWNRRTPIGYRIMSVQVERGVASNYEVLVDGWLGESGKAKGRPVDILIMKDKSILISDDFKGAIYRLSSN